MNVKPGDIARCTFDDGGTPSNVGRQCLVLDMQAPDYMREDLARAERDHGQMWPVQTLEPWYSNALGSNAGDPRELENPGAIVWVADNRLRRIDPPAEGEEAPAPPITIKEPSHV